MSFGKIRKGASALFDRLSLRARLTLLLVFIFGITTFVFNGALLAMTMRRLQQDFDDSLYNYAVDVANTIGIGPKDNLTFPLLELDTGKILPFPMGTALIQVRHSSGKILARVGEFGDFAPPEPGDFQTLSNQEEAHYKTITDVAPIPNAESENYRLISLPLDASDKPELILQIAVPMGWLDEQFGARVHILQIGIPIILLIAIFGSLLVASRALRPLREMIATAKSIDASELRKRITIPPAKDELRGLALTLNEMFERIEKAFQSQERFVADASHQLMTPLTIMKGELEMAARPDRSPQEIDAVLASTRQEVDALARIVQDMLLLARVDAGLGALNVEDVDPAEILLQSMARTERLAKAKSIRTIFDLIGAENSRGTVRGDPDLLESLFTNVVENAIKYSPAGETVRVEVEWKDSTVEVRIRDRGPGIPEEELPRIFERFRRAPGADRQAKGYGLGLAIGLKIAQLHHASLAAENAEGGGALFRIGLKKN